VPGEGFSMQAATFWRTVTMDHADLLEQTLQVLEEAGVRYCVIGGQAVNAYSEPVVSLDLDLALASGEIERLGVLFAPPIRIERFEHSVNLSIPGSDLRIQFQLDPRYQEFPARAEMREVLGHRLPVARLEDVVRGKVWAASDPGRRASKRQKDLADIARLLEDYPQLRELVPQSILQRLIE
jgi:Nucleotidyl transferase AbiEii toxin, Type IV TA system